MKILWNTVTWYSKTAAVIVSLGVIVLGAYVYLEYQKTIDLEDQTSVVKEPSAASTTKPAINPYMRR